MTSNLVWTPVRPPSGNDVSAAKLHLRKLFGDPINAELAEDDFPRLQTALAYCADAAAAKAIRGIIKAIETHGRILLQEVW